MLLFDIGANRGDATVAGLQKGYKVIAVEAAPRVFGELVKNFIYTPNVVPLKFAVSDTNDNTVEFYEAEEDGLSTLNKEWLTDSTLPYAGKPYRTVRANTITIDRLAELYGEPNLIKIDVEGAEWSVFKGMTRKMGMITFEWTLATLEEHYAQLDYLMRLGYTEFAPQFIEHHLQEPKEWFKFGDWHFKLWLHENQGAWEAGGWKGSGLRPTADVGMIWLR